MSTEQGKAFGPSKGNTLSHRIPFEENSSVFSNHTRQVSLEGALRLLSSRTARQSAPVVRRNEDCCGKMRKREDKGTSPNFSASTFPNSLAPIYTAHKVHTKNKRRGTTVYFGNIGASKHPSVSMALAKTHLFLIQELSETIRRKLCAPSYGVLPGEVIDIGS